MQHARAPGITPFLQAELVFLIAMMSLAVIEHALLVLPLPFTALWSWWLRNKAPVADEQAAPNPAVGKRRPRALPPATATAPAWSA